MGSQIQIVIESPAGNQTILVPLEQRESKLADLLRRKDLPLNTRCGQRGLCDGCTVELVSGALVHAASGTIVHGNGTPKPLHGCEYAPAEGEPVRLRIPPRSLLAYEPQVVSEFRINVPRAHDPLWQQLEVETAGLSGGHALADQLAHVVGLRYDRRRPVRVELEAAEQLEQLAGKPRLFANIECRGDQWIITRVAFERGQPAYGVAIDVGTTTVALLLVDLADGKILAQASGFNKQMQLGDDVLTRINLCMTDPQMLKQLQEAIVSRTIQPLLLEAVYGIGASLDQVACLSIAGNTTMLHLLAGVDPTPLGMVPFRPVFLEHRAVASSHIHLKFFSVSKTPPDPICHLLPSAAAYVGADLCAGIFSSGLIYDDGPSLLVDVGTNGEIILKHGSRLLGCATAAGPAFEGAGLASGVRAGEGAVSHIQLSREPFKVQTETIGNATPIGLCGTAYVDFLAEGRRAGLLDRQGRFQTAGISGVDGRLTSVINSGRALRVAYGEGRQELVVSELDTSRLLQAKAAVAAGILTLLAKVGMTPADVKTLYLAGGFWMHMNVGNAIACGLLPGFRPEQVQLVGNTSLAGAYLALLDSGVLAQLTRISKEIEIVELNLDAGFEDRYIDELMLPMAESR